jgi:hypothetical protein
VNFGKDVTVKGKLVVIQAHSETVDKKEAAGAVYFRNGDTNVIRLVSSQPTKHAHFGRNIFVDGQSLAIGSSMEEVDGIAAAGAVYITDIRTGLMTRVVSPKPLQGAQFGSRIALDGHTLVIAAVGETVARKSFAGAVWVGKWANKRVSLKRVVSHFPTANGGFGSIVMVAGGNYVLIGAPQDTVGRVKKAGAVYMKSTKAAKFHRIVHPKSRRNAMFGSRITVYREDKVVIQGHYDKDSRPQDAVLTALSSRPQPLILRTRAGGHVKQNKGVLSLWPALVIRSERYITCLTKSRPFDYKTAANRIKDSSMYSRDPEGIFPRISCNIVNHDKQLQDDLEKWTTDIYGSELSTPETVVDQWNSGSATAAISFYKKTKRVKDHKGEGRILEKRIVCLKTSTKKTGETIPSEESQCCVDKKLFGETGYVTPKADGADDALFDRLSLW